MLVISAAALVGAMWLAGAGPAEAFSCPAEFDRTRTALLVRDQGYADQPYLVALPSGEIGMTLTVSDGEEGSDDQHVVWLVSADGGETWEERSALEPADGPEASWGMPFLFEGRLFVLYLYNTRDVRRWPLSDMPSGRKRVDVIGDIVIRSSTDGGRTWSERQAISVPLSGIDRRNGFAGEERILWMTGAPVVHDGMVYFGFSKVGASTTKDMFPDTESFLLRSSDPGDPSGWEILPAADRGFAVGPGQGVTEEPNPMILDDGTIIVTSRTTKGRILQSVSRDGGGTWSSDWARYGNGKPLRHPRAIPTLFRLGNGRVALWFHNNTLRSWAGRNPVFTACLGDDLTWSQPKMLMCDSREDRRISYPSFLEQNGELLVAETSKRELRLHRFDPDAICE